jgi:hypothetical protein
MVGESQLEIQNARHKRDAHLSLSQAECRHACSIILKNLLYCIGGSRGTPLCTPQHKPGSPQYPDNVVASGSVKHLLSERAKSILCPTLPMDSTLLLRTMRDADADDDDTRNSRLEIGVGAQVSSSGKHKAKAIITRSQRAATLIARCWY